jgi:hypothetical protein
MRKMILALALTVTAGNLAIGVYAAVCESHGGARACGTNCAAMPDGGCICSGSCTSSELTWVDGANKGGGGDEELELAQ